MKRLGPVLLVVIAWCASGCIFLNKFRPLNRTMTRMTGPTGWYRVTPMLGLDANGNATIPPREIVWVDGELDVYPVAAPLSGAGLHHRAEDEDGENRFMKDLGATKKGFPAAAANVRVTHFRTQFPGDTVMEPKFGQHSPNEPGVGVKGATEIDLPENLTHDGSLLFVARRLVTP